MRKTNFFQVKRLLAVLLGIFVCCSGVFSQDTTSAVSISPEEIENDKVLSVQMVKFLEGTLNFLGNPGSPVNEKDIILQSSYLKIFLNDKVQVEDDLDENRQVSLYKDAQAYLKDVNFFFRKVKFAFDVQETSHGVNENGQVFFKVTTNRTLDGITVSNDSVHSSELRYFEINLDEEKKELKIASIYTTRLNEKEDLKNWWNGLPFSWKQVFGDHVVLEDGMKLSSVSMIKDSTIVTDQGERTAGIAVLIPLIRRMVNVTELPVRGNTSITTLEPLSKLTNLIKLDVSGTMISDLTPLRNLGKLESLDISYTAVSNLAPLTYAISMKELICIHTPIQNVDVAVGFNKLNKLDVSQTRVSNLAPLQEMNSINDIRLKQTLVNDLTPLQNKKNLRVLNVSGTAIRNFSVLASLPALESVFLDSTSVSSLDPLLGAKELKSIYCDYSGVSSETASRFMAARPGVLVVYESGQLIAWWNTMSKTWQDVLRNYGKLDEQPRKEQLHELVRTTKISINNRKDIKDLGPLSQMALLKELLAANVPLTDLSPLSHLTDLARLDISGTAIASLDPLASVTSLEMLNIDNTSVSSLLPLKKLPKLAKIYADNSGIGQAQAMEWMQDRSGGLVVYQTAALDTWFRNLPQVWKDIFAVYIPFKSEPGREELQQIVNLEEISSEDNGMISSLAPLKKMENLKKLSIEGSQLNNLQDLAGITSLEELNIAKSPISDLLPLAGLSNMVALNIENTVVEDLEPIAGLTKMKILKLSGSQVKNLKPIKTLVYLEQLECYNTKVVSLDVLEEMHRLKYLKIFNTKISEKKVAKFKEMHPECEVVYY